MWKNNARFFILAMLSLCLHANTHAALGTGPLLNVFDLPSVEHAVVVNNKGHFPVLNVLNQEFFTVYRAGAGYLGRKGSLECTTSFRQGMKWNMSQIVVDSPWDDRNAAVGVLPTGKIITVFKKDYRYAVDGKYDPTIRSATCMVTSSTDRGETWATPRLLNAPYMHQCTPYGRIVSASGGILLLNLYGPYIKEVIEKPHVRQDYPHYSYIVRSTDQGQTWGDPALIAPGYNETTILHTTDNQLVAALRSSHVSRIDIAHSRDGGQTWSFPLRLTGPDQFPADMLHLSRENWILLVYTDHSVEEKTIRGVISKNNGKTWDLIHSNLLFSRPTRGEFGYPSVALLPSGRLGVAYYWAGYARNMYDNSKTRLYCTSFMEEEFLQAFETISSIPITPDMR